MGVGVVEAEVEGAVEVEVEVEVVGAEEWVADMLVPIHHKAKKKYQLQTVKHQQKRSRQLQNYKQYSVAKVLAKKCKLVEVNLLDVGVAEAGVVGVAGVGVELEVVGAGVGE